MKLKKWIGTPSFYKRILGIALPVMIQNGITNLVNLLDNVMIGSLGTEALSAVSIVNQFVFIFNLLIFGASSAAGIFTAQYHGYGDHEGVRSTARFKLLINTAASVLCIILFNTPVATYISYSLNRMLDTGIGVAIALLVNLLLPRERIHSFKNKLSFLNRKSHP